MKELLAGCACFEGVTRAVDEAFTVQPTAAHDRGQGRNHRLRCEHACLQMQLARTCEGKDTQHTAEVEVDRANMQRTVHRRVELHAIDVHLGFRLLKEALCVCGAEGKARNGARDDLHNRRRAWVFECVVLLKEACTDACNRGRKTIAHVHRARFLFELHRQRRKASTREGAAFADRLGEALKNLRGASFEADFARDEVDRSTARRKEWRQRDAALFRNRACVVHRPMKRAVSAHRDDASELALKRVAQHRAHIVEIFGEDHIAATSEDRLHLLRRETPALEPTGVWIDEHKGTGRHWMQRSPRMRRTSCECE